MTVPVLLYLHVPKCGGQTLSSMLRRRFAADRRVHLLALDQGLDRAVAELAPGQLADADFVWGHFPYGLHRHTDRDATYVTVLRDPVSRVVSLYHYIVATPTHPLHDWVSREEVDLATYVTSDVDRTQVVDGMTRQLAGRMDRDPDGDDAVAAMAHLDEFAVVGLVEAFDDTVVLLRRRLGLDLRYYERRNDGGGVRATSVDEAVLAEIRRRNRHDLAVYEHARERFRREVAAVPDLASQVRSLRRRNAVVARLGWGIRAVRWVRRR